MYESAKQRNDRDGDKLTLKARLLWNMKRCVIPANSIFGIATTRRHHLVKSCHAISSLEFNHVRANTVNHSRNVVPLVRACPCPLRPFPVLGVGARNHDFRHHLIGFRDWYGRVNDLDLWACRDNCFFHLV